MGGKRAHVWRSIDRALVRVICLNLWMKRRFVMLAFLSFKGLEVNGGRSQLYQVYIAESARVIG